MFSGEILFLTIGHWHCLFKMVRIGMSNIEIEKYARFFTCKYLRIIFYIFGGPEFIRGRLDEMNRINFLLSLSNIHLLGDFDSKLYVYGLNKYHWTDQYDPIQTRFCTVVHLTTVVWFMMYRFKCSHGRKLPIFYRFSTIGTNQTQL